MGSGLRDTDRVGKSKSIERWTTTTIVDNNEKYRATSALSFEQQCTKMEFITNYKNKILYLAGCTIPAFSGGGLELSPTALAPLGCGNDDCQGKP